jgi:hypothetical protein
MTRKYVEGMIYTIGNMDTKNATIGELMLAAIALNTLQELLSKIEKEETK